MCLAGVTLISITGADFHRLSKTQSASLKSLSLNDFSTTPLFAKSDSRAAVLTKFSDRVGSLVFNPFIIVKVATGLSSSVYPSYLITTGHALQLLRTRQRRDPARTLRSIQLDIWLRIVEITEVIENTNLDHLVVAESRGLAPHVGATVSTEGSGDIDAGISCLRPRLGLSRDDLEAFAGRDDVGAVGGAAHLLAVEAVTQGLEVGLVSPDHAMNSTLGSLYKPLLLAHQCTRYGHCRKRILL